MKDPLGIMGAETIFVMEGYTGRNELEEYQNMDMFKAGIPRKKYKLPYTWDGTGGVVYGPNTFTTIGNTGTHQLVLICINPTRSLSYTFTESRGGACFFLSL